jgi:hypothetical protein
MLARNKAGVGTSNRNQPEDSLVMTLGRASARVARQRRAEARPTSAPMANQKVIFRLILSLTVPRQRHMD